MIQHLGRNGTNYSPSSRNKVGNPLVADRNVFESLEVCVLYMIHTHRTVGYATQYKLYTLRVPSRPIIFKMFPKSETMRLIPVLPISFKLHTLNNLWVPLGPIIIKICIKSETMPLKPFACQEWGLNYALQMELFHKILLSE